MHACMHHLVCLQATRTTLNRGKWMSHSEKKMANTVAATQAMTAPLFGFFSNCSAGLLSARPSSA